MSTQQNLLAKIKNWWNTTAKDKLAAKSLLEQKIDGYTFVQTSGHRALINAKNTATGEELTIIDCGAPDTYDEFLTTLVQKLNAISGGKKRKIRRTINRKGKKKSTTRSRR
jgi:hypothetical protein